MLSPERIERLRGYLLEQQANLQQQLVGLTDAAQQAVVGLGNHMAEDATAAFEPMAVHRAGGGAAVCGGMRAAAPAPVAAPVSARARCGAQNFGRSLASAFSSWSAMRRSSLRCIDGRCFH